MPLLVGGSGLYFQPWSTSSCSPRPPGRARLEAEAAEPACPSCTRLAAADPAAAARIQPGNLRRTVRALEVMVTGRPFSSFRAAMDDPVSRYRLSVVGLDPGAELLRARVAERVEAMAKAGLVDEVRRLAERPLSRTARQALGYKELLDAMEEGAGGAGGRRPADPGLRPPPAGLVPPGPTGAMEYPSSRAGARRLGPGDVGKD